MNRIYQGRVCDAEIADGKNWKLFAAEPKAARAAWERALWEHHELFQDAVNYYIAALAALGTSPGSKLTRLRGLLEKVWEGFDKKGQRRQGMRESLQRAWQLAEPPTLAEVVERFRESLTWNSVSGDEMELAGESLAFDLGGEGSIQQGGVEYWPYFCQSGFMRGVTFPREATQLAKEKAVSQVARLVWHSRAERHVAQIHRALRQFHFCNVAGSGAMLPQAKARAVLDDALATLLAGNLISETQQKAFADKLEAAVPEIAEYAGGSINKDALKLRFCGFLVFKHLSPDTEGLGVFRGIYEKPEEKEPSKKKEPSEAALQKVHQEARLIALGDDPIKLVRARAGMVFRAFTALPMWRCAEVSAALYERSAFTHELEAGESHQFAWKEFDVAAFKEALKVYNQFQQNVVKREEKLNGFATKLLVMDGEKVVEGYVEESDRGLRERLVKVWADCEGKPKPPKNESGEEPLIARFVGDARIDRLRQIINADLAEEYRLTDGRSTPYGLRRRTMKGWGEVKRRWQSIVKKGVAFSDGKRAELKAALDDLRGGEKKEQIGSHKLFEAMLADEAAWGIWREPDDKQQEKILKDGWASDPLEAFREYCEMREAMEEISARPLNFTPADPRLSRRLFMFTDACSFGKDRGEFKHDAKALAVIVPVAVRGTDGSFEMKTCRLAYSAPRLLRDGIRAEGGGYAQDWTQPMMQALFGKTETASNPQELKDAAVQLMPDFDSESERRILLNFPLSLDEGRIKKHIGKAEIWEKQFASWKKGTQFPFLRWTDDFDGKEPHRWWEKVPGFRVLAADLGTRHAASVALVDCGKTGGGTARFIGEAGGNSWFARYRSGAILRLPGENTVILRPKSPLDKDNLGTAFREELYGVRGRPADDAECEQTFVMAVALNQPDLLSGIANTLAMKERLSFPELNDKWLVAVRRAQKWIAACISWHWKLSQPDSEEQRQTALTQLREQDRMPEWQPLADGSEANLVALRDAVHVHISTQRQHVQEQLFLLTGRIMPLRGRCWEWVQHPEKTDCHLLRRTAEGTGPEKVKLRGQRGLSMARIEQLSELRRRWQSLNQSLRRQIGDKPLTASEMRNDPIPDPCPDILVKLENIREQRVNQTAHLILAQALGVKLRVPGKSAQSREISDTHGEYEVARPPVDFIVLEDLSRYLSDQGRAKSENTRLMKWCHRAIMLKVKMLAEPFGIPVLETQAAYSSRFCALTGMAGFRATEVGWEDRHEFRWRESLKVDVAALEKEIGVAGGNKAKLESLLRRHAEVKAAKALFADLETISRSAQPHRTLLAPQPGGPMFITARDVTHPAPAANRKQKSNRSVLPMQADLNAASNLAMRAVAHPGCAGVHHRLRTERKKGAKDHPDTFHAREPRRFGKDKVAILLREGDTLPKERNTNLFYDEHRVAAFGRARLEGETANSHPYASGPGLWKAVNDRVMQWRRCEEINARRIAAWKKKHEEPDEVPM